MSKSKRETIEIRWDCEDGYSGGARPQHLVMTPDEFCDCETIEEAMTLVDEALENDFREKITYSFDRAAVQTKVEAILAKQKAEDSK